MEEAANVPDESTGQLRALLEEQNAWPLRWRWEGSSGHPRRLADTLSDLLEEHGYTVERAESGMRGGPLNNVAEFEGVVTGRARQPLTEALRERWPLTLLGVVLLPLGVGFFLLRRVARTRDYRVGIMWRGEAYSAEARSSGGYVGAGRAGVVSEVRIALRASTLVEEKPCPDTAVILEDTADLRRQIEAHVPVSALPGRTDQPAQPQMPQEPRMPQMQPGQERPGLTEAPYSPRSLPPGEEHSLDLWRDPSS